MIVAHINDSIRVFQIEQTLLAAGFTRQEIWVSTDLKDSVSSVLSGLEAIEDANNRTFRLSVQTQTRVDEDLARAVFRDCGIDVQSTTPSFFLDPMTFVANKVRDIPRNK
jgi:hypothetical protein